MGLRVVEGRACICGWPTDTLTIDDDDDDDDDLYQNDVHSTSRHDNLTLTTHTLLFFIPGNPGVIHWYTQFLVRIVEQLGKGYAVRGISYAGHGLQDDVVIGTSDDRTQIICHEEKRRDGKVVNESMNVDGHKDMSISWTMEGQIKHKLDWIDSIMKEWRRKYDHVPNFMFVTHSIGAHFTQSLLLRRPDILAKTMHLIHLMPFIRFDPPPVKKRVLSSVAKSHKYTIPIMTNLVRAMASSGLPRSWIDFYLNHVAGLDCMNAREIAIDVFMNPNMVKNHLLLGCQELNELTEYPNDVALRLIGGITSTSILFCGNDHWAPEFHFADINQMQHDLKIPNNIHTEYIQELSHDFIVHLGQVDKVVSFCVTRFRNCTKHNRSRL